MLMCGDVCRVRVVMCAGFVVAQPIPRWKGALSELVSAVPLTLDGARPVDLAGPQGLGVA